MYHFVQIPIPKFLSILWLIFPTDFSPCIFTFVVCLVSFGACADSCEIIFAHRHGHCVAATGLDWDWGWDWGLDWAWIPARVPARPESTALDSTLDLSGQTNSLTVGQEGSAWQVVAGQGVGIGELEAGPWELAASPSSCYSNKWFTKC